MIGMRIAGAKCKISLRSKCKIHHVTRERDEILDTRFNGKYQKEYTEKSTGFTGVSFKKVLCEYPFARYFDAGRD